MTDNQEILPPSDLISRLSVALIQVSRGDPIVSLRNELDMRFKTIDAQLAAMEKATDLQHQDMVRVPTLLQTASLTLKEILEQELKTHSALLNGEMQRIYSEVLEKFAGVNAQFSERDTRTDQRAGDTKLAVDAAFAAAKEATAKIEAAFTKQIDGIIGQFNIETRGLTQQIIDLKDRLVSMESRSNGQAQGISSVGSLILGGVAILAVIISFAGIMIGIFK